MVQQLVQKSKCSMRKPGILRPGAIDRHAAGLHGRQSLELSRLARKGSAEGVPKWGPGHSRGRDSGQLEERRGNWACSHYARAGEAMQGAGSSESDLLDSRPVALVAERASG